MKRARALCAAMAIVAVGALTVPAIAANPKDGVYAQLKGSGAHRKVVVALTVNGDKLAPTYRNRCVDVPPRYTIGIKRHGRFRFEGRVKNAIGARIHAFIKGRFKTRRLAVGTIDYGTRSCNGKAHDFRAKYLGPVKR